MPYVNKRLKQCTPLALIFGFTIFVSGCVIEEGLVEEDPTGGSLSGVEVIVAGDEIPGGSSPGGTISGGGEIGGTDTVFPVDMDPPIEGCDFEVPTCEPGSAFDAQTCQCFWVGDCDCGMEYDPICGMDGITYWSECELRCVGQEFAYYGECERPFLECFEPNPEVMYISYDPYECEYIDFGCSEGSEYYYDECGCGCYERDCNAECVNAPRESVCTPNGERYPSECFAQCEGAYSYRPCESSCECDDDYSPQCGLDGNTYSNPCLRECLGVPLNYEGECNALEWLCQDDRTWENCSAACEEIVSCFSDQCSMEERRQLDVTCLRICEEWGPDGICGVGTCFDAPWLFLEDQVVVESVACLEESFCPNEAEGAEYISYDPDSCRLIGEIDCGDQSSFNGPCGCGCLNNSCLPETEARYVSRDQATCERISIDCPAGSELFSDSCGCGCRF